MQDAPEFRLGVLDAAIRQVNDSHTALCEKRGYLLSCLRITRAHFSHKKMWWEQWQMTILLDEVEHSESVRLARAALRAKCSTTPITNRGVTFCGADEKAHGSDE